MNNNNKKVNSSIKIMYFKFLTEKKFLKKDETKGLDILQNKLYIKVYIT